jgi:hypothetical protein
MAEELKSRSWSLNQRLKEDNQVSPALAHRGMWCSEVTHGRSTLRWLLVIDRGVVCWLLCGRPGAGTEVPTRGAWYGIGCERTCRGCLFGTVVASVLSLPQSLDKTTSQVEGNLAKIGSANWELEERQRASRDSFCATLLLMVCTYNFCCAVVLARVCGACVCRVCAVCVCAALLKQCVCVCVCVCVRVCVCMCMCMCMCVSVCVIVV